MKAGTVMESRSARPARSRGHAVRGLVLTGLLWVGLPGAFAAPECDRQCLNGVMDRYLEALAANDPSRAPLDAAVRFTENAQELIVGDGLWATADSLRDFRIRIVDVPAGQVAHMGAMYEGGEAVLLNVRLKVRGHKATEIEHVVVRSSRGPDAYEHVTEARSEFSLTLAPERRRARDEMIRIADLYFEGIEQGTGQIVPFSDECDRYENGLRTTNNPELRLGAPSEGEGDDDAFVSAAALGCEEGFDRGGFGFITEIDPRRYAVIDEEKGLVFGFFSFVHSGQEPYVTLADGTQVPTAEFARRPNDVLIGEVFRIVDGRIREIEAFGANMPYRAGTGWDD